MIEIERNDKSVEERTIEKLLLLSDEELNTLFYPREGWRKHVELPKNIEAVIKLTKEEIDAMGGDTDGYKRHYLKIIDILPLLTEKSLVDERATNVIKKIEFSRTKEAYLNAIQDEEKRKTIARGFELLEDDVKLQEFLSNNPDKNIIIELSNVLGRTDKGDKNKELDRTNAIFNFDFINDEMIKRYQTLRQQINIDIELMGYEIFGEPGCSCYHSRNQEKIDSDWEVNPEFRNYIFEGMNPNYSIEEKIAYIYIKLCNALEYDVSFEQKDFSSTDYKRERQEQISLENPKIMCAEFSRLYVKLINEMKPNAEARCTWPSGIGHEACGVLINNNIRINFEAVNVKGDFNDLARAKLGLPLNGVEYVSDRDGIFKAAFEKVQQEMRQNQQISTENLISAYENLSNTPQVEINFEENMNAFLNKVRGKIRGNELLNMFQYLSRLGYFGEEEYFFIYEFDDDNKKARNILIKREEKYYDLKTETLTIEECSKEGLKEKISSGKMRFESTKHMDPELAEIKNNIDDGWDDL